ncbi:helix-turn-helix transcriptional regulator [Desulfobacter vibrioformis]|uniref:helix-turn-helix transcriptional regulator n=1 Tax=Desulfobacter vibrioformis TaxID=34031 RepID=UPI000558A36E|nr:AraC family transcriptional regulator [Desulfobacter vibrioformis]
MQQAGKRDAGTSNTFRINYNSADDLACKDPVELSKSLAPGQKTGPEMFSITSVRQGFCMYAVRIDPKHLAEYEFEIEHAPLQFGYCLSGSTHTVYTGKKKSTGAQFTNQAGTNSICRMSGTSGVSRLRGQETFNSIAIQIDAALLARYLDIDLKNIFEPCRRILQGESPICGLPMTGAMLNTAHQVFACDLSGSSRQLFMEAKAVELLSLQIDLFTRTPGVSPDRPLMPEEEERIRNAARILIRDMQAPPTISILARKTGLNEFKLKKGFKQVFGTTILQYLQHHRMACARDMIINQGANVSQAADFVGYINIGHFIACYKRQFGTTPGNHKCCPGDS